MFKLVIQDDEGKTTVVPLIRDEITIGRKEGNTIRLTERNVSRRHARILRSNGEVQIEDLGSYNGIRVNNARIAERVSLRVSDQVQIGDYKLYLKAEGVEQVDEARTMPIERVDGGLATEVMPAVSGTAPTLPPQGGIPKTPPPGSVSVPPVSGTATTDPGGGRPVASAAQVAAMGQPGQYGKLVVLSSNFPGKVFELTRPQMIVGRTDENDLVINHRSISRNHAKITRDPETGRYTISDLQSSNGVRVNGQDYGKVELRRADTVDLGHVRLRFVEPGEDFVFERDAQIQNVADTGSKKGLLVAVVLGVLVLAAVAAFFVMNKGSEEKKPGTGLAKGSDQTTVATGSDTQPSVGSDTQVAVATPADAAEPAVAPPTGSNTAAPPSDEAGQIKARCLGFQTDKNWQDLLNCANQLAAKDPKAGKDLQTRARAEAKNERTSGDIDDALRVSDLNKASKLLGKLDDDSVYKRPAAQKIQDAENKLLDDQKARAAQYKAKNKCDEIAMMIKQAPTANIANALREYKCEKVVAENPGGVGTVKTPPGGGSATQTVKQPPPPADCDAEAIAQKGRDAEAIGQHAAALAEFDSAMRCKPGETRYAELAFMAACNARTLPKAKVYYKKIPAGTKKNALTQMCVRNGIAETDLQTP